MRTTGCLLGLLVGGVLATLPAAIVSAVTTLDSLNPRLLGMGGGALALYALLPRIPERYRLVVAGAAAVEAALWVAMR